MPEQSNFGSRRFFALLAFAAVFVLGQMVPLAYPALAQVLPAVGVSLLIIAFILMLAVFLWSNPQHSIAFIVALAVLTLAKFGAHHP